VSPFVSRGGLKLEHALNEFKIDVTGLVCLDVGASTGGFTDCLLQRGAAKVYAIDVAYGQFDWKLRNDPRVVVVERTNIRYLKPDQLYGAADKASLAVIDVIFISLVTIFPAVYDLLVPQGEIVALIKPQFEAKREQVGRGGIVRDEAVREEVVARIKQKAAELGWEVGGLTRSPIEGANGNVEFLIHLAKK